MQTPPQSPDHELKGRRILVVEDESPVRTLLLNVLTLCEAIVTGAENGEQALNCIRNPKYRFDLVVLDLVLPKVRGQEIQRIVRQEIPTMPMLIISGSLDYHEVDSDHFLAKPFSILDFRTRVKTFCEVPAKPDGPMSLTRGGGGIYRASWLTCSSSVRKGLA